MDNNHKISIIRSRTGVVFSGLILSIFILYVLFSGTLSSGGLSFVIFLKRIFYNPELWIVPIFAIFLFIWSNRKISEIIISAEENAQFIWIKYASLIMLALVIVTTAFLLFLDVGELGYKYYDSWIYDVWGAISILNIILWIFSLVFSICNLVYRKDNFALRFFVFCFSFFGIISIFIFLLAFMHPG